MTFYISPFMLGVITTIGAEVLALVLTIIYCAIRHHIKTRRNARYSSRRDKNE